MRQDAAAMERRLFRALVCGELLFVAGHALMLHQHRHIRLLDLGAERSVAAWFSSLQLAAVALVFAILGTDGAGERPPSPRTAFLLAATFLFLSLDEAVSLHKALGVRLGRLPWAPGVVTTKGAVTGLWILPYLAVLAALLVAIRKDLAGLWREAGAASRFMAGGLAVLVLGAAGCEWLNNRFLLGTRNWSLFSAEVVVEEFLEMLGVTLVLRGALLLRRHRRHPPPE